MSERLQKFLAGAGVASRRKAEELVAAGRVTVNGQVVREMGTRVDPSDLVVVDGRPVVTSSRSRYLLLYKPPGCVTTLSDPQGRPTVAQYLAGISERVFPVGRLDWDAEGALLFTTDGELANRLAHPRYGHQRTYLVKVRGEPPIGALDRMISGVRLEDGPARALEAKLHERAEKNTWIRVVVGEGRRHLVKRLCESVGMDVQRLFRPEFGGVTVAGLQPGRFRDLGPSEVESLRRAAGMSTSKGRAPETEARPLPLPRAARRHGHGAPEPRAPRTPRTDARGGGSERPERDSRTDRGPRRDRAPGEDRAPRSERSSREDGTRRNARNPRADTGARGDRGPREERDSRGDRGSRTGRPRGPRTGRGRGR